MKIAMALMTLCLFVGNPTLGRSDELRLGLSRAELSSRFGNPGTHQFSLREGDDALSCVSYSFGARTIKYYFVFRNGELASILDTRPFFVNAFERKPHPTLPGASVSVRKPWKAEEFTRGVIGAKTLSPRTFSQQLESRLQKMKKRKKSYSALPAFALLAPLIVPDIVARTVKQRRWLRDFDAQRIKLGMARDKVSAILGTARFTVKEDSQRTYAFGPTELLWRDKKRVYLGSTNKRYWLAVVYEQGVVVRVFSNDLFNDLKIVSLENEVK